MASDEFLRIARDVASRDRKTFDVLMEFEDSGKVRTKERMNFTIDKSLAARFRKMCREKGYSMSAKVEQAIAKMVDEEGF